MANWWLVRAGWAVLLTYPPNVRYVDWFTEAQRLARDGKAGLWSSGGFNCPQIGYAAGVINLATFPVISESALQAK